MRAAKDVHPHEELKCPTQSPKHIKDDSIDQESFSSGRATGKDAYALAQEESSPRTNESWTTDQTGVDSSMQSRPSTPENAETNDKIKVKEEPSNLEIERSNLEEERSNVEKERSNVEEKRSNLEEEKCLQTASKNTLIGSPVVSPMRENISNLRFGNLLHLNQPIRELKTALPSQYLY